MLITPLHFAYTRTISIGLELWYVDPYLERISEHIQQKRGYAAPTIPVERHSFSQDGRGPPRKLRDAGQ